MKNKSSFLFIAFILLVFISGMFFSSFSLLAPIPDVVGSYNNCDDCSQVAKNIAWSIDHHPEEWEVDKYYIRRGNRVKVWISNGMEYLDIERGDEPDGSGGWQPSSDDKILLWHSISPLLDKGRDKERLSIKP